MSVAPASCPAVLVLQESLKFCLAYWEVQKKNSATGLRFNTADQTGRG